jgi:hypothetical protein
MLKAQSGRLGFVDQIRREEYVGEAKGDGTKFNLTGYSEFLQVHR